MSRPSRVVLPVLDLEQNDKPLIKRVVKGCKEISVQRITADSSGQTSCSFSWQPPSQNTIMDRRIEIEVPFIITKTDTTAAGGTFADSGNESAGTSDTLQNIGFPKSLSRSSSLAVAVGPAPTANENNSGYANILSNNFAPRQFPIASIIETIDMTINGTHFTASLNQYLHALMTYTTPEYREKVFGGNAYHHPDKSDYDISIGLNDNPLNKIGEGGRHGETPRGAGFNNAFRITTGAHTDNQLSGTITEPLFLSPLMMEFGHGMTNVNDVSITINWSNDKNRIMSLIATNDVLFRLVPRAALSDLLATNITTTIDGNPNLVCRYYQAQDDIKIPNEIVLPYKQPKIVLQAAVSIAGNATQTFTGNNIRLNQVPESVYLYAKRKRSDETVLTSDTYAPLTGVRVSWKNKTGVLSGFRFQELLQASQENGCDVSSAEAYRGGFVCKLVFGKDIPLDDNESGGTRGDYNWQVECDFQNHSTTRNFEFYQVFVYTGHAIISPNECRVMTGILDLKDNVEAEEMGDHFHGGSVVGGSVVGGEMGGSLLGSTAKHLGAKLLGKETMGVVKDFKPCADAVSNAYSKYKTRA